MFRAFHRSSPLICSWTGHMGRKFKGRQRKFQENGRVAPRYKSGTKPCIFFFLVCLCTHGGGPEEMWKQACNGPGRRKKKKVGRFLSKVHIQPTCVDLFVRSGTCSKDGSRPSCQADGPSICSLYIGASLKEMELMHSDDLIYVWTVTGDRWYLSLSRLLSSQGKS